MFRKDPIIRMLLIIILGSIAFQLLFNMITRGGSMEDMNMNSQNMMNSNGTIDSFLSGLLVLLVKFLLIILVISIMVYIFMWIKNSFFKDVKFDLQRYLNQNPFTKSIAGIGGLILGLFLIIYLFNYISGPNMNYNYSMNMMSGTTSGFNGIFSNTLGLNGLMTFLIEVLCILFIVSLTLGLVSYVKKQFDSSNGSGSSNNSSNTKNTTEQNTFNQTDSVNSDTLKTSENNSEEIPF